MQLVRILKHNRTKRRMLDFPAGINAYVRLSLGKDATSGVGDIRRCSFTTFRNQGNWIHTLLTDLKRYHWSPTMIGVSLSRGTFILGTQEASEIRDGVVAVFSFRVPELSV